MALSRHYSEFHDIIKDPPIYEAYTVIFVEQPSFALWIPVKINVFTSLTHEFKA